MSTFTDIATDKLLRLHEEHLDLPVWQLWDLFAAQADRMEVHAIVLKVINDAIEAREKQPPLL